MQPIKSTKESLTIRLGTDLRFPINGSFAPIAGLDLLLQDIQLLLLTIPGERVNNPTYGCNLRNQIWENIDTVYINGAKEIKTALTKFEPRITVISVSGKINRNTDLIIFNIKFLVNSAGQAVNLVFPLRTGTSLSNA